jgi:hypothetical protein
MAEVTMTQNQDKKKANSYLITLLRTRYADGSERTKKVFNR